MKDLQPVEEIKREDGTMIVFQSIEVDDVGIVISMKDGDWSMAVSGKTKELIVDLKFIKQFIDQSHQAGVEEATQRAVEFIKSLKHRSYSVGPNFDQYDAWSKEFNEAIITALKDTNKNV